MEIMKNKTLYACFIPVSIENDTDEIKNLHSKKASQNSDLPTNIIEVNAEIYCYFFSNQYLN